MLFCFVVAPLTVRKRSEYENMDNDIVQGDEDHHNDDEDGETGEERLPVKTIKSWMNSPNSLSLHPLKIHLNMFCVCVCVLTERDVHMLQEEEEEKQEGDHRVPPHQQVRPSLHLFTRASKSSVLPLSPSAHLTFTPVYHVSYVHSAIRPQTASFILPAHCPALAHSSSTCQSNPAVY